MPDDVAAAGSCTVLFLIAGKLDFASINPHAA